MKISRVDAGEAEALRDDHVSVGNWCVDADHRSVQREAADRTLRMTYRKFRLRRQKSVMRCARSRAVLAGRTWSGPGIGITIV
jgi:hypothetical protein